VNVGLRPPEIGFRPLDRSDLDLLADWLRRPHVAQWWREPADPAAVEATYGPMVDGTDPTQGFIAVHDGRPLAFLQRYRLDDNPEWKRTITVALAESGGGGDGDLVGAAAGIDYLIGEQSMTGQGLGRTMIAAFVDLVWDCYPDITSIVVAVDQANAPSWGALQGVGFVRVWAGVLSSDDPSDDGPCYLYARRRPGG
jgi:aminoglycoside 6'-N-acetyltransferase